MEEAKKIKKPPKALLTTCHICNNPATSIKYYGGISCFSCRAFFRRVVNTGKEYRFCQSKTENCEINSNNRRFCKRCRFNKCLQSGMKIEKVNRVKNKNLEKAKNTEGGENEEATETIEALAEECMTGSQPEDGDNADSNATKSKVTELREIEENATIPRTLHLEFTPDEEFSIYELIASKEGLLGDIRRSFHRKPEFVLKHKEFLAQVRSGSPVIRTNEIANWDSKMLVKVPEVLRALNVFRELKDTPNLVREKIMEITLTSYQLCIRAFMRANLDKPNFMEQQKCAGTISIIQSFYYKTMEDRSPTMDPFKLDIFHSPWAVSLEDEHFFMETIDDLGFLIGDDVKLGTLFMSLVLVTPLEPLLGIELDSNLGQLLMNLRYLIYRYLRHKFGSQEVASNTSDLLMRTLKNIDKCRMIHLHRRLRI